VRFQPSREQRDFAAALADLLTAVDTPSVVRAWGAGDATPGRKLWSRLADQGVLALATPEQHGGYGATAIDLVVAFEQLGRFVVPGPLVESVAVLPALLAGTSEAFRLDALASGEQAATLAMPPDVPWAVDAELADAAYLVDGGALYSAAVGRTERSVDAARHLSVVTAAERVADRVPARAAFELGALATAAYVHGAGRALIERSVAYAKARTQFATVIGKFQAVKHQLADAYIGLELARPLLFGAALALDSDSGTAARDVSAAKVAASDTAYRASRVALQVHGAIGYTSEYDLALWLTKVRALHAAWGAPAQHRARVLAAVSG
jgi:hypothetical protein